MEFWTTLAASIISGGVAGAIVRYILDARRGRFEYAMKLHEQWWTPDFHKMRQAVIEVVTDLQAVDGRGPKSVDFLDHFERGAVFQHPAGAAFVRIVFFFSDLNACLDKGLVDRSFAYRLFGESQYFWFAPLIDAVREKVKGNPRVRWAWETGALGAKFKKLREKDERRRAKHLLK